MLSKRTYQCEEDFWHIRAFLREVFLLNNRREITWQVARWDYWRWHGSENLLHYRLEDVIFLWETIDRRIAAVLNPEDRGDAFLQVHPDFDSRELKEELVETAAQCLSRVDAEGRQSSTIWVHQQDTLCQHILRQYGYQKGDWHEYQHRRSLDTPIADVPLAPGYTVRPLGDVDELPARSWLSWRAFHPDEPDERYEGWEWYHNIQRIPQYRRDLDIVAVAPDGELAAFCTVWYDDVTRTGYFEPVGTSPDHQRLGLGKAVMVEGMKRLKRLGGTLATVAGFSQAANALYASVMAPEYVLLERWQKSW